jgi:hypothetical protein
MSSTLSAKWRAIGPIRPRQHPAPAPSLPHRPDLGSDLGRPARPPLTSQAPDLGHGLPPPRKRIGQGPHRRGQELMG